MEYLIRWDQGIEPEIGDDYRDILKPASFPSTPVDGDAPYCIDVLGCRFEFSWEPPGLQITVESNCTLPEEHTFRVVNEIRDNIVTATETAATVVRVPSEGIDTF